MQLSTRRTLGRSGLPVSPLALGTMTFGNRKWGSPDDVAATLFHAFVDAGGNFIDTADVYSGGRSEELVGHFIAERKLRDRVVLATKFSFSGGNGRKNLHRALEGSLRRLATDYVDLYWMHVWDRVTPPEEMLQSMGDLVRAGKIRYFGLSDVPAWYAARMATLAQVHNVPGPIALQLPYSLVERTIEHEHVPAALALGMGVTPWSPLAAGFLTGKYSRGSGDSAVLGGGRLDLSDQPFRLFTDRNWTILDILREVSQSVGKSPAEIALAWALAQPGMTSLIFGASKPEQLENNLAALDFQLPEPALARLNQASGFPAGNFYSLFEDGVHRGIFGGTMVEGWLEVRARRRS